MQSLYFGLTKEGIEQVKARVSQNCACKRGNNWICTLHNENLDDNGICSHCEAIYQEGLWNLAHPEI